MQLTRKVVVAGTIALVVGAALAALLEGASLHPSSRSDRSVAPRVGGTYHNVRYGYAFHTFGALVYSSGVNAPDPKDAGTLSIESRTGLSVMRIDARDPSSLPDSASPLLVELWSRDACAQAEAVWNENAGNAEYDAIGGGRFLPFKYLSPLATTTIGLHPACMFDVGGILINDIGTGAGPVDSERHIFVENRGVTLRISYPIADPLFDPLFERVLATVTFR